MHFYYYSWVYAQSRNDSMPNTQPMKYGFSDHFFVLFVHELISGWSCSCNIDI